MRRRPRGACYGVSHDRCTSADLVQPILRKCSETREPRVVAAASSTSSWFQEGGHPYLISFLSIELFIIFIIICSFSNLLSVRDALNCTETGRLTGCPARVVSPSCPIFPPPHLTVVGFCAVLDRTRWHVSQFRHGDDQIPSGGSFRAVPQQHSIFDLRVARGVRYRKGPVRCVP